MESYFACGEYTHPLRLTSKLVDLRAGYAKRIRRAEARRATSFKLRRYDARCCIISTEGYRSGHNEAVLKTVWVHAHVGSNPTPSAKNKCRMGYLLHLFFIQAAGLVLNPSARS